MSNKLLNSYDHYVSETYLKHFSDKPEHVFVYRKKKKLERSVAINSICGNYGGDICDRFENKFGLREILANIEPAWNIFIQSVKSKNILTVNAQQEEKKDEPSLLTKISLYIAYLRCLSPSFNERAQKQLEDTINNDIMPFIADLKNTELSNEALQAIKDKKVKANIDETYLKAMGINSLAPFATDIYKRDWQILENKTRVKFVTCDTPVILLQEKNISQMKRIAPIYLPLTPEYALLIHESFGEKVFPYKNINLQDVKEYNKLVVQSASDMVISSKNDSGISKLVDKYRKYGVEIEYYYQNSTDRKLIFFRHVVKSKNNC